MDWPSIHYLIVSAFLHVRSIIMSRLKNLLCSAQSVILHFKWFGPSSCINGQNEPISRMIMYSLVTPAFHKIFVGLISLFKQVMMFFCGMLWPPIYKNGGQKVTKENGLTAPERENDFSSLFLLLLHQLILTLISSLADIQQVWKSLLELGSILQPARSFYIKKMNWNWIPFFQTCVLGLGRRWQSSQEKI